MENLPDMKHNRTGIQWKTYQIEMMTWVMKYIPTRATKYNAASSSNISKTISYIQLNERSILQHLYCNQTQTTKSNHINWAENIIMENLPDAKHNQTGIQQK